MSALRIHLFGTIRVSHAGRPGDARPIHGVQSLLAWLLLHRQRTHTRESLTALFWGDQDETHARGCLSTALWRLRQVLEPSGVARGTYLVGRSDTIAFNCQSDYWLDVAAFEDGVADDAESALACYGGDLLEGFYDEWIIHERERLRMLYLDTLAALLQRHSDGGDISSALRCARRILSLDPLREDVHRHVIRLHVRSGQRALALQQYATCRGVLLAELGIEPMAETRALCDDLLGHVPHAIPESPLLPKLRTALARLDEARDAVADALRGAADTGAAVKPPVWPSRR